MLAEPGEVVSARVGDRIRRGGARADRSPVALPAPPHRSQGDGIAVGKDRRPVGGGKIVGAAEMVVWSISAGTQVETHPPRTGTLSGLAVAEMLTLGDGDPIHGGFWERLEPPAGGW